MPKTKKGNGGPVKNGGGGKKSRVAVACNLQPFYQDRAGCVAAFCAKNVNDANSLKDTNGANVVNGTNGVMDTKDSHLEVGQTPFRHCVMRNLLDEAFLPQLREELAALRLREKSNDLYQFRQSGELNRATGPCLSALRETLLNQVKPILSEVTTTNNCLVRTEENL